MKENSTSAHLNRRGFVKIISAFLGSVTGIIMGFPLVGYVISPALKEQKTDEWVSLGALDSYLVGFPGFFSFTRTRVNGWEKTVNAYGVFVLRKSQDELKVLSDICTHLSCRIKWHEDIQEYVSRCHDGHFDIDGNVTYGPPPRPLDQYEFKIEVGEIFIYLV
jgi:menaquinol-cytochrome c reductase iron-sulfur subunit